MLVATSCWVNSKAAAIAELGVVGLIFAADFYHWHHLILVSKTPYILLFAWLSLRVRGQKWKAVIRHNSRLHRRRCAVVNRKF